MYIDLYIYNYTHIYIHIERSIYRRSFSYDLYYSGSNLSTCVRFAAGTLFGVFFHRGRVCRYYLLSVQYSKGAHDTKLHAGTCSIAPSTTVVIHCTSSNVMQSIDYTKALSIKIMFNIFN